MMPQRLSVEERDDSGRLTTAYSLTLGKQGETYRSGLFITEKKRTDWRHLLSDVFLPAGFPATVSPDYLQYQIYNALQAFCSSLAGLIASRAVLQGHGVGKAGASATHAIFLTVLQDIFSRLTTIVAGYYLGTSLFPEAKAYRLMADIFNDAAIILDTLSPHLGSFRVASLCLSGAFRALCGVVAGGSKAALTVHFATTAKGAGDVGDLSAKDGSKETVLALLGMLSGTAVMHYVHSTRATYVVLFALIALHLFCNYLAVRVVVFRSLNRQRASIVWAAYRAQSSGPAPTKTPRVLTPTAVAAQERIFPVPTSCHLGVPFAHISVALSASPAHLQTVLSSFSNERYLLWADSTCCVRVCLKEGHLSEDQFKAWVHAQETARLLAGRAPRDFEIALAAVQTAYAVVEDAWPSFVDGVREAGWRIEEGGLLVGSPRTIRIETLESADSSSPSDEDRKRI